MTKHLLFFMLVIIVGALLGSFIGKFIETAFPEGSTIRELFATEISTGLNPTVLNLRIIELTFGCLIKLNITAVIGILIAGYIFKTVAK